MNTPKKKLRIHFWVEPRVQIPYLLTIMGFSALACVGTGILFYMFLSHINGIFLMAIVKILQDYPTIGAHYLDVFAGLLLEEKAYITWTYIGVFSILMIGCAAAGILLSHRYAGPIIAFRRTIRQIIQGESPPALRLRPGDEMRDLMDAFNKAMDGIKQTTILETQRLSDLHTLATEKLSLSKLSENDSKILKQIQDITQPYAA